MTDATHGATAATEHRQAKRPSLVYTPKKPGTWLLTLHAAPTGAPYLLHGTLGNDDRAHEVTVRAPGRPGPNGPFLAIDAMIDGKRVTTVATLNAVNARRGARVAPDSTASLRMNFSARGAVALLGSQDAARPTVWAYIDPKGLMPGAALGTTMACMGFEPEVIANFEARVAQASAGATR